MDEQTDIESQSQIRVTPDTGQQSIYEKIRDAILDGTFPPGSQLIELAIADLYDVSRTPVRESLGRLEQDGLVERGPRGLIVRTRSPEEILDIYDVRILLETAVARLAAERHTEVDGVQLLGALDHVTPNESDDTSALIIRIWHFHHTIWSASHSQALIDLLQRLKLHLLRYPETTLSYPGRVEESAREHRELAQAILDRDPDKAAAAAEAHLTRARNIRLELWGGVPAS